MKKPLLLLGLMYSIAFDGAAQRLLEINTVGNSESNTILLVKADTGVIMPYSRLSNGRNEGIVSPFYSNLNLTTFPNPFVQKLIVGFTLDEDALVKIEFTDMHGKLLYVRPESILAEGDQKIAFNGSMFGEGMVIFNMSINGILVASVNLTKASSK